ncbi:twin-arginine translocase subunit TatC [Halosimplex sp. TS25]|uniref:twin-arginine translocase subunit TatC n=1 Tax=Halosimplex rarum TaxID=3396619 RepID=UPI0039ECA77A
MTDERPGDGDDDEGAAGPPDESVGGDPSDRSESSPDESVGGDPSDRSESSPDESPDPDWTDDAPSERPDDAGPSATVPDPDDAEAIASERDSSESDAAADGGSDATEFGGDINPHVDPSTGGPAEGAPAAPENVGAPDDQEMPLAEHIEEMVRRLGVIVVVMALVSGLAFPFADRMINFLWYSFMPGSASVCPTTGASADAACPHLFHPLALMFARLKVASLVGFIAALPLTVYESYLFMRPGLYPRERRYYLASVPTSLVLAVVGVFFAYLLVLPTLFAYFTGYTGQAAEITFSLTETFNLIVMMLGFFALVFQIPLLIMLAVMMGVTSRRWLAARRIYFWGGFATVAFLFSPDPTGMAPILVAATMILLFEGTLLLLYWTSEATTLMEAEAVAARRPFAWLTAALAGYAVSTAPLPQGYYDQLPAAVTSALAEFGLTRLTPLFIGIALIALYEGALYLSRRAGRRGRAYRAFARARVAVWPLSLAVGYLGSPDPELLQRVDAVDLSTVEATGVVVGLIVAFEFLVVVLDWYQSRE